ncbi:MAG: PIN domain-containing protein [Bifidobacteriaceae bacterium]|jgi:predicted nucleic-acid-binding protein|nr:PIN domain-containing protein [Bifidobacteriaceae bacterium]
MPSLDTNCLLRWLLGDVPAQQARVDGLIAADASLAVEDVAVIEAVYALERSLRIGRETITEAINTLVGTKAIAMDRDLWHSILKTYLSHPKLSLVDIYLAQRARRSGQTPLYTFDAKMINQLADASPVPAAED